MVLEVVLLVHSCFRPVDLDTYFLPLSIHVEQLPIDVSRI
jgi:hypothetical protein